MIIRLDLDRIAVVALGKNNGAEQPRTDLRAQTFLAEEGWTITPTSPGTFTLWCEGMPVPVEVGGYGYSCVHDAATKGKRR